MVDVFLMGPFLSLLLIGNYRHLVTLLLIVVVVATVAVSILLLVLIFGRWFYYDYHRWRRLRQLFSSCQNPGIEKV